MKKAFAMMLTLMMVLACMLPSAAYSDGEVIFSDNFDATTLDYADREGNYEVEVKDGKLHLLTAVPSSFYALPIPDLKGVDKFTVTYDWEVVATTAPTNPGHTLYFAYGIKDMVNGIYVGVSHVNGTEHLGTVIDGSWGRRYRSHYCDDTFTLTNVSSSKYLNTEKFSIKIEVESETARVYVNGVRFVNNGDEEWKDADQVKPLWTDGKLGFVSRGMLFEANVDNLNVYAGVGLQNIGQPAADTTAAEVTTAAPETTAAPATTTAVVSDTTAAPITTPTTADGTAGVLLLACAAASVVVAVLLRKRSVR